MLLKKITPTLKYVARRRFIPGFYSEEDLYQEMCLYLWEHYGGGLPAGINEAYVIKGCEFDIRNFMRKERYGVKFSSIDEPIGDDGLTLGETLEDKKDNAELMIANKLTVDEINNMDLSGRERLVISYLLKGYTAREIAAELGISHVMVLKHKKAIIKKWEKISYQKGGFFTYR